MTQIAADEGKTFSVHRLQIFTDLRVKENGRLARFVAGRNGRWKKEEPANFAAEFLRTHLRVLRAFAVGSFPEFKDDR
jgi:hypothetical protein